MSNPAVQLGSLPLGAHFAFHGQHGVVIGRTLQGVRIRRREKLRDGQKPLWRWVEDEWSPLTKVTPEVSRKRMTPLQVGD